MWETWKQVLGSSFHVKQRLCLFTHGLCYLCTACIIYVDLGPHIAPSIAKQFVMMAETISRMTAKPTVGQVGP